MLLTVMMVSLLVFVLLGLDVAFSIGLASLIYIGLSQFDDRPVSLILFVQDITAGVDSFALLAIPLFIFAGELMAKGGIIRRIILLAMTMVGGRRGGLGNVCVTANFFLAGVSGSATADTAAVGASLIPEMNKRGYQTSYSAGIISASACMAAIVPPSIMLILMGSIANISIGSLFLAGIVPGILMFVSLLITNRYISNKRMYPIEAPMTRAEKRAAIRGGILPLFAPIIVIATKVFGIATPTESAALVVTYTLTVSLLVYRDLTLADFLSAARSAVYTTSVVVLMVGTSHVFGTLAVISGLGDIVGSWLTSLSSNPFVLLLVINVVLLALGTIFEPLPIMIILTPILFPLLVPMGVDPIHLGFIIVYNLILGSITPPVGLVLFVMSRVAKVPVMSVFSGGAPFYAVLILLLLAVTYIPPLAVFLPNIVSQ